MWIANWIVKPQVSLLFGALMLCAGCDKFRNDREPWVSGTIETDEARVASRYGGRVVALFAEEGDPLAPGQPIVTLDAEELKARRDHQAALLQELNAGPRPEEIRAAKNDWEALAAQLEFARSDSKRLEGLFQLNTVAETDRDRAASQANALEKSMAAAKSRYDLLLAGTRKERIEQAEAQLREIDTQLREMKIVSPTNAVLESLHVRVGDVLAANQDVATVLLTNHLWVRVYVPEPWLGFIKPGDQAQIKVDADPSKGFTGQVEQVARAAEFTPRNVQTVSDRVKQVFAIKIRLPNNEPMLRAGMAADALFPQAKAK